MPKASVPSYYCALQSNPMLAIVSHGIGGSVERRRRYEKFVDPLRHLLDETSDD
jgi:hypothetical protein